MGKLTKSEPVQDFFHKLPVSLSNSIAIKKIHCFSEKKWSKKDDPLLLQKYTFELTPFVRGHLFVSGLRSRRNEVHKLRRV